MYDNKWFFHKKEYTALKKSWLKKNNINARGFIVVKYRLPFELPFKDNTRSVFKFKGYNLAIINQSKSVQNEDIKGFNQIKYFTELDIVVISIDSITTDNEESKMHSAIDLTLDFLNILIISLQLKFHISGIKRISRLDLDQIIPVAIIKSTSFQDSSINLYGISNPHFNNIYVKQQPLNTIEIDTLIAFVNDYDKNIFNNAILYFRDASNLLDTGNFNKSVISIQTGVEIFMYTLLKQILITKGEKQKKQIENILKLGYKNILSDHLGRFFESEDVKFTFDEEENSINIINGYKKHVYMLRNKIVHEGYICKETHAVNAKEVVFNMIPKIIAAVDSSTIDKDKFDITFFIK